jgi:ribosomal-protein-alanine N-acetyltransferase
MIGSIVPVDATHAAVLAGMHHVCFAEPWDERAMSELLAMPGAFGFLATGLVDRQYDRNSPQGFILCRAGGGEAEVLTLLVLPPFRRLGLAKLMLDRGMQAARAAGATALFLEVAADNSAGRSLYSAHGFLEVGRRPRYYSGLIDALVLRRDL